MWHKNDMEERKCNKCLEIKPIEKFKRTGKASVYRRHTCRSCLERHFRKKYGAQINGRRSRNRTANPVQAIYTDSRLSDRKKGRRNDLTREAIAALISSGCRYCGETAIRMTLDRVDNTKGHTLDNVVPACIRCNAIRGSMPYEAWQHLVAAVREARELGLFGSWLGPRFPIARVVEQEDTTGFPGGSGR